MVTDTGFGVTVSVLPNAVAKIWKLNQQSLISEACTGSRDFHVCVYKLLQDLYYDRHITVQILKQFVHTNVKMQLDSQS